MGENTDDPDEGEILEEAVRSLIAGIHTSMPARIISYTHSVRPRATVRPVVRFSFMDPDTEQRVTQLPESIANVPILFPSSTNHSDTWPLAVGDPVYLLIAERSLDEWLANNNADNAPQDPRRFDVTDAVALPALGAGELPADAVSALGRVLRSSPFLLLGSASATSRIALSPIVADNDADLVTILTPIITAWNIAAVAGGPLIVPMGAPLPLYLPASTASAKVLSE